MSLLVCCVCLHFLLSLSLIILPDAFSSCVLLTVVGVMIGQVLKFPALMALIPAWRYFTVWLIEGRLYALFSFSDLLPLLSTDIAHKFAPLDLHCTLEGWVVSSLRC